LYCVLTERQNEKPLTGLISPGQMYDVCAVPPEVRETLEILWMRSYQHNVGSHAKLPTGSARNRVTRIHVCNAKSIDVRRPSGKVILHELKENLIKTSRVVMLFAGRWTR